LYSKERKKLFAWGRNDNGQTGVKETDKVCIPTDITSGFGFKTPRGFSSVSAGKVHSGVVLTDGYCYTWGGNELGQLGVENIEKNTSSPQYVVELSQPVAKIACGYTQTAFLMHDGSLMICGHNDSGQLGVEDNSEIIDVPIPVRDLNEEIAVVTCSNFNCALSVNQNLYIWGDTPNGMFLRPEKINGLAEIIKQVAIGEDMICVLDVNNFVYSWGRNESGQLGLGDTEPQKDACSIDALNDREVVGLFAGKNFVMGLGRGATKKKDNPLLEREDMANDGRAGELVVLEEGYHEEDPKQLHQGYASGEEEVDREIAEEEGYEEQQNYEMSQELNHPNQRVRSHGHKSHQPQSRGQGFDSPEDIEGEEAANEEEEDNKADYQLPKSIIDLYKNQKQTEAIYPIKDVEKMQADNKTLLKLVCAYEKVRQDLVNLMDSMIKKQPALIDGFDPRDIQK